MISLEHNGTTYDGFTAEELSARGVPDAVIDQAINQKLSAEANRRILGMLDGVYTNSTALDAIYAEKEREAKAYRDEGYPASVPEGSYRFIVGEAQARGLTKRQHADAVIAAAEAFRQIGSVAEALRAELPAQIAAADTLQAKRSVVTAALTQLKSTIEGAQ